MAFKLVSCDGGGIRGYLSCLLLEGLHAETGFLDKADGFAGTSTGGLISVVLADGRTRGVDMEEVMSRLTQLYCEDAAKIFKENDRSLMDKALGGLMHHFGVSGGPGIRAAQYTSKGLEEVGRSLVGDRTVGSLSPDLVLAINTVCLDLNDQIGWAPFTVSNQKTRKGPWLDLSDMTLLDVAMASAAAPTYFPPHRVKAGDLDLGYFADGGVFANNPVLDGIDVAIAADMADGLDDVEAVSVGTGLQPVGLSVDDIGDPDDWGALKWFGVKSNAPAGALLDLALTASAENQFWIAHLVMQERLARVNPPLSKSVGLATFDSEDFSAMRGAYEMAKDSEEWEAAVKLLGAW